MKTPKENPRDVQARQRERTLARRERNRAAEESASSLTSDLRGVYGIGNFFSNPVATVGAAPRIAKPRKNAFLSRPDGNGGSML